MDKVEEQAEKYGHSQTRELAFLTAHSMLHLFGYDHMEGRRAAGDGRKQKEILETRGIQDEKRVQMDGNRFNGRTDLQQSF